MILTATLAVLALALLVVFAGLMFPRYLVTIQKTTNVNQQPEVVTLQAKLPWWTPAWGVWVRLERMANAAVNRMETINSQIMEVVEADNERIARLRDQLSAEQLSFREHRIRKMLAKRTKVKPHEVPQALVDKYLGAQLEEDRVRRGGEPASS